MNQLMSRRVSLSPSPRKILVIAMRYLGDVLLITPLVRSIRNAYPEAQLDVLVFRNTAAMLEGNPDINTVITTPNRPKVGDYIQLIPQLFGRYDLAITTQAGDRPFLYSVLAAPFRVAVVPQRNSTGWWKRFFMQRWTEHDDADTHTVLQNLKLADVLGIKCDYTLVPPQDNSIESLAKRFDFLADDVSYAVLHMHPQWVYKRWTRGNWVEIGRYLNKSGLKLIVSGGASPEELDYVADIAAELPGDTINIAGKVSLAQLAAIIARAKLFIGPDTGITHMAAGSGIPVIALYGPTNPVKWAPWPKGFEQDINPFEKIGSRRVNNISLIQGEGDCVPCGLEGCDRHRQSRSQCLDRLSVQRVKETIEQVLNLSH
jgi:heptosyltransferase-3